MVKYMTSIELLVVVTTRVTLVDWLEFVGSLNIVRNMTAIEVSVAVTISEFTREGPSVLGRCVQEG
jgi:hypothetical protein